jgi:hypothetical protein
MNTGFARVGGIELKLPVGIGLKCTNISAPKQALKKTLVVEIVEHLGNYGAGRTSRNQEN